MRAVESVVCGGERLWIEQRVSLDPSERVSLDRAERRSGQEAVSWTISETSSRSDPESERSSV